jgi:hypothetical protein
VPLTLEKVVPVATRHEYSEHLMVTYDVVPLCQLLALGPTDNQVAVALASVLISFCATHCVSCATTDLDLLLQSDACDGEP